MLGAVLCVPVTCWEASSTYTNENMIRAEQAFAAVCGRSMSLDPSDSICMGASRRFMQAGKRLSLSQ